MFHVERSTLGGGSGTPTTKNGSPRAQVPAWAILLRGAVDSTLASPEGYSEPANRSTVADFSPVLIQSIT